MNNLLISLATGIVLITAANILLSRLTPLGASRVSVLVALATVAVYVPLAILDWPGSGVFALHLAIYLFSSCAFGLLMESRERAGKRRWHWGPAVITGFFIFIIAVNSVFIVLAERGLPSQLSNKLLPNAQTKGEISSVFPGVISHNFQEKEALYNEYLRRVERQQERGWQIKKGWLERPVLGEPVVFQVAALDSGGRPLAGAEVVGEFLRPSDSRLDRPFSMRRSLPVSTG
jgi:nitrogen fixation protein FixH